jgi:hypothetical protein
MPDANGTQNPESPEKRELTPEQAEAFETATGFAELQMMAAQEDAAAGTPEPEGRERLPLPAGCRPSAVAALIALVLIIVAFGFYAARLGSDPTRRLSGSDSATKTQDGSQSGTGSGGGAQQGTPAQAGSGATGAHDDSVPHQGQQWGPTYIPAGEWQIALAAENPLLRDNIEDRVAESGKAIKGRYAKSGKKMLLVEVRAVNNGSVERQLDPSFFSLKADDGKVYPVLGVEPQAVRANGSVWLETYFEVPTDTQGTLHFSPPESMGGKAADVPLPPIVW